MRGPTPKVQRALGWNSSARDGEPRVQEVWCSCGSLMDFEVRDPEGFGRSFQRCTNPACSRHTPHQLERQMNP